MFNVLQLYIISSATCTIGEITQSVRFIQFFTQLFLLFTITIFVEGAFQYLIGVVSDVMTR